MLDLTIIHDFAKAASLAIKITDNFLSDMQAYAQKPMRGN
jgi:hypothetical protein